MLYGSVARLPFHIAKEVGGNELILNAHSIAVIASWP